ncbi:MAG: phosphoribosyl-ATP diphosphatase, partial [Victivallales bacterium]|nr:phosphoribosyl-ATP diphosphatase [Victivallales bacterium]
VPALCRGELEAAWTTLNGILQRNEFKAVIREGACGLQAMRFKVELAAGIPVSAIRNLHSELNSSFGQTRMELPISGTSLAGIEIPVHQHLVLDFSALLASEEWNSDAVSLPLPLGWELGCGIAVHDLKHAPHLLVAGDGKSGRSTLLQGIAASLALRFPPHLLNLVLWDPTGILKPLQRLPHISGTHESCISLLEWLEREKHHRHLILQNAGAADIDDYNRLNPQRPLPIIAAFMLDAGRKNQGILPGSGLRDSGRLGIHVVAAFSVLEESLESEELTRLFPWRAILKNAPSQASIHSPQGRKRLCNESTLLLGNGDMLFVTPESTSRIQIPELSREACRKLTKYLNSVFNRKYLSLHKKMNDLDSNAASRKEEPMLPFSEESQQKAPAAVKEAHAVPAAAENHVHPEGHSPIALDALKVIIRSGETTTEAISLALEISPERAVNLLDELTSHDYLSNLETDGTRRIIYENIPPEYLGKSVLATRKDLDVLYNELKRKIEAQDTSSRTVVEYNKGVHAIGKKIIEEAGEVWMSAEHEAPEHTAEEISQLIYHLVVLMLRRGITPEDIYRNL